MDERERRQKCQVKNTGRPVQSGRGGRRRVSRGRRAEKKNFKQCE